MANDSDVNGDDLGAYDVTDPAHGIATIGTDGKVTYTPDVGFSGEETFDYYVTDGRGGTASASVTVTVSASPPPRRSWPACPACWASRWPSLQRSRRQVRE